MPNSNHRPTRFEQCIEDVRGGTPIILHAPPAASSPTQGVSRGRPMHASPVSSAVERNEVSLDEELAFLRSRLDGIAQDCGCSLSFLAQKFIVFRRDEVALAVGSGGPWGPDRHPAGDFVDPTNVYQPPDTREDSDDAGRCNEETVDPSQLTDAFGGDGGSGDETSSRTSSSSSSSSSKGSNTSFDTFMQKYRELPSDKRDAPPPSVSPTASLVPATSLSHDDEEGPYQQRETQGGAGGAFGDVVGTWFSPLVAECSIV